MRKIKEAKLTFGIGANLSRGFVSSFSKATEVLNALNLATNKINKNQKQNSKTLLELKKSLSSSTATLKPMKEELDSLSKSINSSQAKMKKLSQKIEEGGRGSKNALRQYNKLSKELKKLEFNYNKKLEAANKIETQIKNERKEIEKLTESYKKNADELKKIEKMKKFQTASKISETIGEKSAKIGGTMMVGGTAGISALTPALYTAIKAESAFADVKKQFDFSSKEEEEKFKKQLQDIILKKKLAVGVSELYAAAASAGQSGIGADEAIKYVEHGIKTGIAFDINKDEAAKSLFVLRNSFNLTYDDMVKLTDVINMFGNTTGANAAEITEFVNRVGNIGTVAGFSTEQIAALGATLIEQGMTPEIAATGAKKLMGAMTKGFAASSSQAQAFKMIGLNPNQLAKLAQKDAEGAMLKIFNRIGKLSKDKQGAIITLLFGEEGLRGAAGVLQNQKRLIENLKNSKNKALYEGSIQKEADVRGATKENKIQVLKANMDIQLEKIGNILFPELEKLLNNFSVFLDKVSKFQSENPKIFSGLIKGAAYGSVALLGLGTSFKIIGNVASGASTIFKGFSWMVEKEIGKKAKDIILKFVSFSKQGLISFCKVLKTAAISIGRLGVAMLTNPITWYIAGIVALIAVGYALYKNWDTVKQKALELKDTVISLVDKYWFLLGPLGMIIKMGNLVYQNWDTIKLKALELKNKVVEFVMTGVQNWEIFKSKTMEILKIPFDWLEMKIEKLHEKWANMSESIIKIWEKIKNFSIKDSINSGINWTKNKVSNIKIPGFATGGIVSSPTLAMVGEGKDSESIIPHNRSQKSLNLWEKTGYLIGAYNEVENRSKTDGTINFTFSPVIYSNSPDEMRREIEKQKRLSFNEFEKMYDKMLKEKYRRGNGR